MPFGDPCPQCKVGHLYPSGERWFKEDAPSRPKQEYIALVCDKCGHKHQELVLGDMIIDKMEVKPALSPSHFIPEYPAFIDHEGRLVVRKPKPPDKK
jgi:hypothetical protein